MAHGSSTNSAGLAEWQALCLCIVDHHVLEAGSSCNLEYSVSVC
jgi:hypothetical protein